MTSERCWNARASVCRCRPMPPIGCSSGAGGGTGTGRLPPSAAVLFVAVLVIVRSSLPTGHRPEPARPRPITARSIAGTYAVRLRASDKQVDRQGLEGPYSMQLKPDGSLLIIGPHKVDLPWNPATFEISRGVLNDGRLRGDLRPRPQSRVPGSGDLSSRARCGVADVHAGR